jgi:hypothetical protein
VPRPSRFITFPSFTQSSEQFFFLSLSPISSYVISYSFSVIERLDFQDGEIWQCLVILMGFTLVFRVLVYIALRLNKKVA